MTLVTKGNKKLGPNVWTTSLTAGESCPGATAWCRSFCYAEKGFFAMPTHQRKYAEQLTLLREDPGAYEAMLGMELAKLAPGSVFRFHVSGDIVDEVHVGIIRRLVASRPDMQFFLYTRSWRVAGLRSAITRKLRGLENLHVWASTDQDVESSPKGWREARVFPDEPSARAAGYPVCPEQTGRRASCSECGLCWSAKPSARLAFIQH